MDGGAGTRRCTEAAAACGRAQGQTGLLTWAKPSQRGCVLWFMLSPHPYLQPQKTSLLFILCRLMAPLKDSEAL